MISKESILTKIDLMVDNLSQSLSSTETANGWTEAARVGMLDYFKSLRNRVRSVQPLLSGDLTIIRGLDAWGITKGDLFHLGTSISSDLRYLVENENWSFLRRYPCKKG